MKLYLFRHGETELKGERRFIGHTDVALSETGKRQALWWRTALDDVVFRRIYCSDLVRARQTADILVAGTMGSVTVLPPLREINLGQWEGLTVEEVKTGFPGQWEKRGQDITGYRPPCGESFADLADRVVPTFEEIGNQGEEAAAVVGHAGVNRVILCHVLGMPINRVFRLRQDYGALNLIEGLAASRQVCLLNLKPEWPCSHSTLQIVGNGSEST